MNVRGKTEKSAYAAEKKTVSIKNMRTSQEKIYNTIKTFYHENKTIKGCLLCSGILVSKRFS